jgi:hypothetical protein
VSVPVVTNTALASLTTPIAASPPIALTPVIPATNIPTSWAITATSPSNPTWFTIAPSGAAGSGQVSLTAAGKTGMNSAGTGTESLTVTASNAGGTSAPGTATIGFQPASSDAYASVDGSPGASTGAIPYPNILNGYRSSGSGRILGTAGPPNYAAVAPGFQPPWKVAGVDYAVGINAGVSLKIPTNANLPVGATISGGDVTVGTPHDSADNANRTFDGFDFTNIAVTIWSGNTATFTNCLFAANGQLFSSSTGNGAVLQNLVVKYCKFTSAGCSLPGGPPTTDANNFTCLCPCSIVVQYCWVDQAWTEGIQIGGNIVNPSIDMRFNLFSNGGRGSSFVGEVAHGDLVQQLGNTINSFNFSFNTAYQNPAEMPNGPQGGYGTQVWSFNAATPEYPNGCNLSNNTNIIPSGANVNSIFILAQQWVGAASAVNANFCDLTGMLDSGGQNILAWFQPNAGFGPGPFNPGGPFVFTGNISMTALTDGTHVVAAGGSLDNLTD